MLLIISSGLLKSNKKISCWISGFYQLVT